MAGEFDSLFLGVYFDTEGLQSHRAKERLWHFHGGYQSAAISVSNSDKCHSQRRFSTPSVGGY